MNWGYKILLVYGIFIAGIVSLVILSSRQNRDLVAQDYYEKELKFQDKIDQTENAASLSSRFEVTQQKDTLKIGLPQEMKGHTVKAQIFFYSPSDKSNDIHRVFESNNAELFLIIPPASKGFYKVKVEWLCEGKVYYDERKIEIS